jgi:hypothetical protein
MPNIHHQLTPRFNIPFQQRHLIRRAITETASEQSTTSINIINILDDNFHHWYSFGRGTLFKADGSHTLNNESVATINPIKGSTILRQTTEGLRPILANNGLNFRGTNPRTYILSDMGTYFVREFFVTYDINGSSSGASAGIAVCRATNMAGLLLHPEGSQGFGTGLASSRVNATGDWTTGTSVEVNNVAGNINNFNVFTSGVPHQSNGIIRVTYNATTNFNNYFTLGIDSWHSNNTHNTNSNRYLIGTVYDLLLGSISLSTNDKNLVYHFLNKLKTLKIAGF